jgi:hypothetical protein
VNNNHGSAIHTDSGDEILENNVLISPIQYLSPILAYSGGNNLKNEYLMLDDIYPPTTLEICGTDSLDHILITASYPRSTTPNNEKSQETEPEPDDTVSNSDYKSAFHIGFGGKTSEKENLEFGPVPASTIDSKFTYSRGEILNFVFDKSPPAIHKKSGHPTDSNRENLTMKEDCRLNLTWKADNASSKLYGCRKREKEICAICKRSYCDLRRYIKRNNGEKNKDRRIMRRFPCKIYGRSDVQINRYIYLLYTKYRIDRHQKGARNILESD